MFPDPDIVCKLSSCTQLEFADWFCVWVRNTIYGTKVDGDEMKLARNRQELMECLKYRQGANGALSREAPERVQFMASLVYWPTLTAGGPRYIQPVRVKYLEHDQILAQSLVQDPKGLFSHKLERSDYLYASFGHLRLGDLDLSVPVPLHGRDSLRMVSHPALQSSLICPNERDLCPAVFFRAAGEKNRDVPQAILEWMRLDVRRIQMFFDACRQTEVLSKHFRGKLEDYRLMHLRLSPAKLIIRAPRAEESIVSECQRASHQVDKRVERLESELAYCKGLKSQLVSSMDGGISVDRYAWKKWAVSNKPVSVEPQCSRVSVPKSAPKPRPHQVSVASRPRVRMPVPKRGRPLAVKLVEFRQCEEEMMGLVRDSERASARSRDPGECNSGGRISKKRSKGNRSITVTSKKLMTQDEIEESVGYHFGPDPSDDLDFLMDD
jgi:hypothetical protein